MLFFKCVIIEIAGGTNSRLGLKGSQQHRLHDSGSLIMGNGVFGFGVLRTTKNAVIPNQHDVQTPSSNDN